jgi:ligand-binding sensor domain-containing protein/signal transduction histidine kinase
MMDSVAGVSTSRVGRWFARVACVGAAIVATEPDAFALDGQRGITQYVQTHYETREGLPLAMASSIAQTSNGYLWTGSEEGLTRYDGTTFTTFNHRNTAGIPANYISALAVDPAGGLWAGTRDHGVVHLVDGEFHAVVWGPGAGEAQIRALAFDHGGDLWVGVRDHGLVRLRAGDVVATLSTTDGLPSNDIRTILADREGTLWIATFHGLAQLRDGHIVRRPSGLDGFAIHGLAQDARGDLWCATERGLAHLHGDTVEWVRTDPLTGTVLQKVLFDRDGNLWIGTSAGVARMTPNGEIVRLPHPDVIVLALFEDAEGNLWIGSENGLDRLRDGDVLPFGSAEGFTDEAVYGVREDPTGTMWLTTSAGVFRRAPGETASTKIVADHGTMFAILPDSHGDVWIGSRDGDVGRWHDGRFAWLGKGRWEWVRSLAEAPDGLWIGTERGLFRMHGDRLAEAELIVPELAIQAIVPDAANSLWLATSGGVLRWSAGALVAIPAGGPSTNTRATTLVFDRDGTMWVGTEGAGLWRLRDDRWAAFTAEDGMFDDLVWRILDDGRGNLWMSSNRGIWRVSRTQLDEHAAGLRAKIESVPYGEADGMRDRECNGAIEPSGWRTRDGRLWFPTGKGLAVIDPTHLHPIPPPSALVENVRIDGQASPRPTWQSLPPGSSRLEISYTALVLRGTERLRFRYRLEGFDHTWNDAGGQRDAQYTNLPPGGYRFIVEAGIDGAWGRSAAIELTLRPQFYQTRGFTVLAIAAIVLAIVAVPLLRIRQLRGRERELAERVRDAVHELAEREQRLRDTQAQLVEASRLAGRSDVATAVLHNVGNVLNSVSVSATVANDIVTGFRTANMSRIATMIAEHRADLGRFFRDDPRGQRLPDYFMQLQEVLERDRQAALTELKSLLSNIDHIKVVVSSQQSHIRPGGVAEVFEVHHLIEDALRLSPASRAQDAIEIVREIDPLPQVTLDRHKTLQILTNLFANARDAVSTTAGARRIRVAARRRADDAFEIAIEDNGCGIDPQNLVRIFELGFTTKIDGQGLGLHYSACAARELRGNLTARSAGIGLGATFLLVLPIEARNARAGAAA